MLVIKFHLSEKLCWIYIFLSRSMSKLNACKIRETKAGAYFKDFKFMDLHRSLLKHSRMILWFYFLLSKLRIARFTEVIFKCFIFMDKNHSAWLLIKVPLQGPTLGSHPRPLLGSHLRVLGFGPHLGTESNFSGMTTHLRNGCY